MGQENMGIKTFVAGEDLEAFRRVKLSSGEVVYADAGEEFIGVTISKVSDGGYVGVAMRSAARTYKMVAAGAFALGAVLYGAADGKVDDAVSGTAQGVALEAATADGDIVECLQNNGAAGNIGAAMIVDEEAANGAIPILIRKLCEFDATPSPITVLASAARKMRIVDWWLKSLDTTASNITVKNAGTSISTAVLAKGTADDAIVRAASVVEEQAEIAAEAAVTVEASAQCDIELYILAIPVA